MASIDNEYIVRLLCVCLGTRMMLVSEFVPFGSLKDYLKKFKSEINAETLLIFATQVASVCIVIKNHICIYAYIYIYIVSCVTKK